MWYGWVRIPTGRIAGTAGRTLWESGLLRLLFVASLAMAVAAAPPAAARYASIVVEAGTGRVLHAANADTKKYPASLTKIMTLFMTFEALRAGKLRMGQKLPVSRVAQGRSPSKLGLRRGETITVRDAIPALVTKSANDVATVLAEAMGGTERKFAVLMTKRARKLGMRNTTFKNASGLPNRRQLSTARDMSILARALLKRFPKEYREFSRRSWKWRGRNYRNHNRLLASYAGLDGIKTGYIRASGYNLVASAERGNRRLIAVVFGGKSAKRRNRHIARLLDKGFAARAAPTRMASVPRPRRKPVPRPVPAPRPKATAALAKFVPVPTPRPKATAALAGRRSGGAWSIQVGAFNRYDYARRAITKAARTVPSLQGRRYRIVTRNSKIRRGLKIYEARVLVASRFTAQNSCRALKRRKIDCLVVRTAPGS